MVYLQDKEGLVATPAAASEEEDGRQSVIFSSGRPVSYE